MKVTAAQISRLKALLQSGADADFFFASIRSADWAPALLEHGFFDSPPKAERSDEWVRYPAWPQSRYLARVAAQDPKVAVEVALHIPVTDNANVNDDILHVALAVPPNEAVRLLPRIADWAKDARWRWGAIRDIAALLAHVAAVDPAGARSLLRSLIAFQPDPEAAEKDRLRQSGDIFAGLEPRNSLSAEDYRELLEKALPSVSTRQPLETLRMLAGILAAYIRDKVGRDAPPTDDGSLYWRPSIPDHEQNPDHKQVTYLVSALRRCGEDAVRSGALSAETLLPVAGAHRWDIFRRLEMYWGRVFLPAIEPVKWKSLLLDAELFFNGKYDLEYGELLKTAFASLAPGEQAQILTWTEQGPREDEMKWMAKLPSGEAAPPDIVARRVARWRLSRLIWIKDQLPPEVRIRYAEWVALASEPEHPGFHVWTGPVEVGVRSPTTVDEFKQMPFAAQLEHLRNWKPAGASWNGPTQEGLAGTLQVAITANPMPYFERADEFIGLEPVYLCPLFRGLGEGLKGKPVTAWAPFWRLTTWILAQPDPVTSLTDDFTGKAGPGRRWQSVRTEVARIANALLRGESILFPPAERTGIWPVIAALADDPNPTPDEDRRDEKNNSDPYTHSLNTVRGEAVHGVFQYLRWVRRFAKEGSSPDLNLEDVPEARAALERRLDPKVDPSPAIRSIFGANLTWLAYGAETWLRAHLAEIFPEKGERQLQRAAWETYVLTNQANSKLLDLLRPQFATAIHKMSPAAEIKSRHEDPRVALGQHLVANYWWGKLDFANPRDLLTEFYARAPQAVRAEVMTYIGRSVAQASGPLPGDIRTRLVKFWEWRLEQAKAKKKPSERGELGKFVWWFDSGKFDPAWAARQMVVALELSHATEYHSLWMKRFAGVAAEFPFEAIRALELTVRSAQEKGEHFWEDEEALEIFKAGATTMDAEILSRARRAQNILLGMGKRQYRDVLPPSVPIRQ